MVREGSYPSGKSGVRLDSDVGVSEGIGWDGWVGSGDGGVGEEVERSKCSAHSSKVE